MNSFLWLQRDRRPRNNRVSWSRGHPELLPDRSQHEHRFHQREVVADAGSRPTPEGEIGVFRQRFSKLFGPAFRNEFFRTLKITRVPMLEPLAHDERGACRDEMSADLAIVNRFAAD